MDRKGEGQQQGGNPMTTIDDSDNGGEDHRGGQSTRMQVLVGEIDRDATNRHGEQRSNQSGRSPLRLGLQKAATSDTPAAMQQKEKDYKLPEQRDPGYRQMRETNRAGDQLIEDCGLELHAEIIG